MIEAPAFQTAKVQVIKEYFLDWESRADFVRELANSGHGDEALLLACCYVDCLGRNLFGRASKRHFVRVLTEYGGNSLFGLLHPLELEAWLRNQTSPWAKLVHDKTSRLLESMVGRLLPQQEMFAALKTLLESSELGRLEREMWRSSIASIIYTDVRSEAVHGFPPHRVTFGKTVHDRAPVPALDFALLGPALDSIIASCKAASLSTGKFFGHDFAPLLASRDVGRNEPGV